ncbi:acylphosphatase [uncultured Gemmiger sp.]|uniref:acylphosphatase n=1 Tax=uncultured Gemmiger sp. TaxID=1623490 RepID=UPI0025EA72BE|nr:acylphosphatase [uncultured Gemmiger sp.]
MSAPQRRHWRFTGSVQGVGFRYRAQYAASLLGLTGWVVNNWDGSVELEAQGDPAVLDKLVPTLTATSKWIMIENMTCRTVPLEENERGFRVRG